MTQKNFADITTTLSHKTSRLASAISAREKAMQLKVEKYADYAVRNINTDTDLLDEASPPVPIVTTSFYPATSAWGVRLANNLVFGSQTNCLYVHKDKGRAVDIPPRDMQRYIELPTEEQYEALQELKTDKEVLDKLAEIFGHEVGFQPWMLQTQLHVQLHNKLRVPAERFREKCAIYLEGMHEDLVGAIETGMVELFEIPDHLVRYPSDKGWFERHHTNLSQLIFDMKSMKISSENRGGYFPKEHEARNFHAFVGSRTGRGTSSEVRGLIIGQFQPRLNLDGSENKRKGWAVIMHVDRLVAVYAALITGRVDGSFDKFIQRHWMPIHPAAFAADDAAAARKAKDAERAARKQRRIEEAERKKTVDKTDHQTSSTVAGGQTAEEATASTQTSQESSQSESDEEMLFVEEDEISSAEPENTDTPTPFGSFDDLAQ